jgi:hypothetical protein
MQETGKMVHVKHVKDATSELFPSLSLSFNQCPAQNYFLNGCGHGCVAFCFFA